MARAARDGHNPSLPEWAARLQSWDPGNAIPYLIEAQPIGLRSSQHRPSITTPAYLDALGNETAWHNLINVQKFDHGRADSTSVVACGAP